MARLEKFRGPESLSAIRDPHVVADTAVGAATSGLGRQIRQSAGQAGQLAQRLRTRQDQIDGLETQRAIRKIDAGLTLREAETRQTLPPGATGFTEAMLAHLEQDGMDAREAQPQRLRDRLSSELNSRREAYLARFAAAEYADNLQYFRDGISEVLETLVTGVREQREPFDAAVATMTGLLDSTPLPTEEKAGLLQSGRNAIGEAWLRSWPARERLRLLHRPGSEGAQDPADGAGLPSGAALETFAAAMDLPPHVVGRLDAEARDELAEAEVNEEDRIAAQIAKEGRGFDPDIIHHNPILQAERRTALLEMLEEQSREEDKSLAAADWAREAAPANAASSEDRRIADRAFLRLTEAGTAADVVARTLLRRKKLLPPAFAAGLEKELRSPDPDAVLKGHEALTDLFRIDPVSMHMGASGQALSDARAKWRILTGPRGMSRAEAARQLAEANDPALRARLEDRFRERKPDNRMALVDAAEILRRLGGQEASAQDG